MALLECPGRETLLARLKALDGEVNASQEARGAYRVVFVSGIYVLDRADKDVSFLLDCANEARKTLKGSHKSACAFYSDTIRERILQEQDVENVMEQALAEGQFIAYYQPQYDVYTGKVVGAEALVRWQRPGRGLVPPGAFIPILEKNGFVVELDFYIYEQVCKTLQSWKKAGRRLVPISSNFSRVHLGRADFMQRLEAIAARYEVDTRFLEVEITESAAQENPQQLIELSQRLKAQGFRIAMDDFGSGYSSLNLLRKLPVDTLKLDKEFLQEGAESQRQQAVIEGFVSIAHKLGMLVVCEGVETRPQAEFLASIGCHLAQGFLYGRPMPLAELEVCIEK